MTALWIVLGILLLLAIAAAVQVDDWSRDLSTNTASTDMDSPDEALRPLHTSATPEQVAEQIQTIAADLPRWRFVQLDAVGGVITVHLVRRSALFHFADDVILRIESNKKGPPEEGSIIHAQSRSRIGRGDLGQNPRNLKQILEALKTKKGNMPTQL